MTEKEYPIAVAALTRKRGELAGLVAEAEKRVAELRADLVHIDNALRIMNAPIDPETIPDPLAPENILRGSGRGIFLIKAFMDEVNFRQLHPGTELTLIKHKTPAKPGT